MLRRSIIVVDALMRLEWCCDAESGVALRLPPHSKTQARQVRNMCLGSNLVKRGYQGTRNV
jgi:hypothetical protein